MKCPWRVITREDVVHSNGSKNITQDFGDCYGNKCPFLRQSPCGFDSIGFQITKEYCARAITEADKK